MAMAEASSTDLITPVADAVAQRLKHPLAAAFAQALWGRVPVEELRERNADDDVSATIACFKTVLQRQPDALTGTVTNPVAARDGWSSTHTVVRINVPNQPFVTDSVLIALSHDGVVVHHLANVVLNAERDSKGHLTALHNPKLPGDGNEVFIYAEIDRLADDALAALEQRLAQTLRDAQAAVQDFAAMRSRLQSHLAELASAPLPVEERDEAMAFLNWLNDEHFVFLGYREFDYSDGWIRQRAGSELGTLKQRPVATARRLEDQPAKLVQFLTQPKALAFSKSGTRSRVHRYAYPDYIGIRRFDTDGKVIGEAGFLGLYTSRVYLRHPSEIPVLRQRVARVREQAALDDDGFDGKVLANVLATYPRDELFAIEADQLAEVSRAVTYIHERRRTRVFTRPDPYGLFVSCLVYLPRDLYDTHARRRIQNILESAYNALDSSFEPYFSESTLVRLQIVLRVAPDTMPDVDAAELEERVVEATRDWGSDFRQALVRAFGEARAREYRGRYEQAFSAGYRERYRVETAIDAVAIIEELSEAEPLAVRLWRLPEEAAETLHIKVFHRGAPLTLSDITPKLENLGFCVLGEYRSNIACENCSQVSMQDFEVSFDAPLELAVIEERISDALINVWRGSADDDGFNRLILGAGLAWHEADVLRAYARYMKQIRSGFSREFIFATLARHAGTASRLFRHFANRFDPDNDGDAEATRQAVLSDLEQVPLLNEDRILRRMLELIDATLRTNYYVEERPCLAFKLAPRQISDLPRPAPAAEIFISAPTVEGVHLRSGPIARGGIRWSDRLEDFRTEVLGLVKAQAVKNALIVPAGAKGGFVVRQPGLAGVDAYRTFIRGLLSVTDNIVDGTVKAPERVVRYDGDDPYLVVAADKGTASFSDTANEVSDEYGFWLGDAFASGGSNGYDHKKMGITARGAWVSVTRHFAEKGVNIAEDPVTVVGIGDMGGDVFGNGMLLSRSLKVVAAFNHLHIFVDPQPDPATSYTERERLFGLPRSSWADYDRTLISPGGGVFERTMKSIPISNDMRTAFAISAERLTPDELINALLKAPVDLIFNGGIGTYVKATTETHNEVGDRANDHLRINATELRCKVVGEGGNLGLTQRARVEFARTGGAATSDFIDNCAGVSCSDHEVNIKVALNQAVVDGELTVKQRNTLLAAMTDEVAELVLTGSHRQVQSLALAEEHAGLRAPEYLRFMEIMEAESDLDRALEFLPSEEEVNARGFTRPELAVLMAYGKTHIKRELLETSIPDDPVIAEAVLSPFPAAMLARFEPLIRGHRLRREIIATEVANDIVHHMGISFVTHVGEYVNAPVEDAVRAYFAAAEIFAIRERYRALEADTTLTTTAKNEAMLELIRLGRRASRWLLRHHREARDIRALVTHFKEPLRSEDVALGAPVLAVIDAAHTSGVALATARSNFSEVGDLLQFRTLATRIGDLPVHSRWQALERDELLDELVTYRAKLAVVAADMQSWYAAQSAFAETWQRTVERALNAESDDYSLFTMTCRRLGDLVAQVTH